MTVKINRFPLNSGSGDSRDGNIQGTPWRWQELEFLFYSSSFVVESPFQFKQVPCSAVQSGVNLVMSGTCDFSMWPFKM